MKNSEKDFAFVARLTLLNVPKMSKREREQLALWIEAQAAFVRQSADKISTRYIARKYNRVKKAK